MSKIDFRKELNHLYNPSAKAIREIDVPPLNFLMIDGAGDPNTSAAYQQAVEALFSVAYTLKFLIKKELTVDYAVMPLEGLWWVEDMSHFSLDDKSAWQWTAMIMQPEYIVAELFEAACNQAARKKNLPALSRLRLEIFHEGRAAQIMHLGPYAAEAPTIEKLHRFIAAQGGQRVGKHHEIYLNDPNRTASEKLKTVIRQPFE
ncbi:MAG: hypothetical protein DPW09_02165 [Anaerolineae bacterium]|nr:GyrI-like domain-containing protein [Anaerolineae bacterium]MCQ3972234.1 hypothetical protein [Anaerolineae bacterium]